MSHTWGSTGSGRVGTEQSGVGTREAVKVRRKCDSGECVGAKVSVALKWLRIPRPSRGAGQARITRKEWEKNCPARIQGSDKVLSGEKQVPSTPITEIGERNVRLE